MAKSVQQQWKEYLKGLSRDEALKEHEAWHAGYAAGFQAGAETAGMTVSEPNSSPGDEWTKPLSKTDFWERASGVLAQHDLGRQSQKIDTNPSRAFDKYIDDHPRIDVRGGRNSLRVNFDNLCEAYELTEDAVRILRDALAPEEDHAWNASQKLQQKT